MPRRLILTTLAVAAAVAGSVAADSGPAHAATVPAGFTDSPVATFAGATTVEWLPDDRIAVLEKNGALRLGRPGAAGFATAIDLAVCTGSERGLLGLTPHPGFLTNGYVFVYYTRPSASAPGGCVNRVSRFQLIGDTISPASEVVLLDNISSVNGNHNGGDLEVGGDGFLYVAVGDAGRDPRGDSGSAGANDAAQDLSLLNGKILRVTLDGAPAPGNPLTGSGTARCATRGNTPSTPTTSCQEIYAWGLRNPYRFAFDPNADSVRFFINDVGQNTREEVNLGAPGRNYGWPMREGRCPQGENPPCAAPPAGLTDPLTDYGRDFGTYVTAGAFVPNGLWPAAYDGGYLFGDGGRGRVYLRTSDGAVDYSTPFASGAFGIVDMVFGFDVDGVSTLYYLTSSGTLRSIRPTGVAAADPVLEMKMVPVTPFRAFDTRGLGDDFGTGDKMTGGTTRVVDLDPPAAYEAALVNLTYAGTAGGGFARVWPSRTARPETSSLNADRTSTVVANSAIVPLAADGSFVLETTTTGHVIVDVMAWLDGTSGTSTDGRFVAFDPVRLADTREPAGEPLPSGSGNPWTATAGGWDVTAAGELGVPDDGTAAAVVLSIAALAGDGATGYLGAYPGGTTWPGNSNVNVVRGDIRANLVVVPLGDGGVVSIEALNLRHAVVDLLGYVTSDTAASDSAGLYTAIATSRIVDTRDGFGFGRLAASTPASIAPTVPAGTPAVVQNVTVARTSGAGFLTVHPDDTLPVVSTLNFRGAQQIRAALAFSALGDDGAERFTASVPTDLVVDLLGYFTS